MFISRARRLRGLSTTSSYHARFASVTAAMVKELRETSGAPMMDCKKALTESGGEIEMAMDVPKDGHGETDPERDIKGKNPFFARAFQVHNRDRAFNQRNIPTVVEEPEAVLQPPKNSVTQIIDPEHTFVSSFAKHVTNDPAH